MIIDLLRHGEVEGEASFRGHIDEPLTKKGHQQMSSALKNYLPEAVIHSPLMRCELFSKQWANDNKIKVKAMSEFMEIDFGDWDGLTVEQIQRTDEKELNEFWNNPAKNTPPNGETLVAFQQRVIAGWNDVIHQHKDQHVLVVTHGGVIRMIIAHILSIPLDKLLSIECPLAAMSRIRISFDDANNHYSSLVSHGSTAQGISS